MPRNTLYSGSQDGKQYSCSIRFLDDSEPLTVTYQKETYGQVLFDQVCRQLNLIERDCFGLRYVDGTKQRHWLDLSKSIYKQLKYVHPPILCFRVKFYCTDPLRLKEEITRYFLFLQLRRDLHHGRLLCMPADANLLAAYIIQSELGDYDPEEHLVDYVSQFRMLPKQTPRQEQRIAELHKSLAGQTPAEAEANFLLKSSQLDTYGVDPHPVKDQSGAQVYLGVTHLGVVIFQGSKRTRVFQWSQITKITFEGKIFIVHAVVNEKKQAFGYKCPTVVACKHLWKCAVEQRYFYTSNSSSDVPKVTSGGGLFHRSCKLRFSGRCELEAFNDSIRITREQPQFKRVSSNPVFARAYSSLRAGSVPTTFNALGLSNDSLDSIDQRETQTRSLDDFSLLSPSLRRVVMGYHMIPEECNGPMHTGSLPNSILSPHPSPTLDDPMTSMSQTSGDSNPYNSVSPQSSNQTNCNSNNVTPKKGSRIIIDHLLAALLAAGVAVVLALVILLLGPEQEHGTVTITPVAGEFGS